MTNAVRSADTEEARAALLRLQEARAQMGQSDPDKLGFFDALYAGAVPDDILRTDAARLAALAKALWAEAGKRPAGAIRVALLDDSHETVLVGINDDRPFPKNRLSFSRCRRRPRSTAQRVMHNVLRYRVFSVFSIEIFDLDFDDLSELVRDTRVCFVIVRSRHLPGRPDETQITIVDPDC